MGCYWSYMLSSQAAHSYERVEGGDNRGEQREKSTFGRLKTAFSLSTPISPFTFYPSLSYFFCFSVSYLLRLSSPIFSFPSSPPVHQTSVAGDYLSTGERGREECPG